MLLNGTKHPFEPALVRCKSDLWITASDETGSLTYREPECLCDRQSEERMASGTSSIAVTHKIGPTLRILVLEFLDDLLLRLVIVRNLDDFSVFEQIDRKVVVDLCGAYRVGPLTGKRPGGRWRLCGFIRCWWVRRCVRHICRCRGAICLREGCTSRQGWGALCCCGRNRLSVGLDGFCGVLHPAVLAQQREALVRDAAYFATAVEKRVVRVQLADLYIARLIGLGACFFYLLLLGRFLQRNNDVFAVFESTENVFARKGQHLFDGRHLNRGGVAVVVDVCDAVDSEKPARLGRNTVKSSWLDLEAEVLADYLRVARYVLIQRDNNLVLDVFDWLFLDKTALMFWCDVTINNVDYFLIGLFDFHFVCVDLLEMKRLFVTLLHFLSWLSSSSLEFCCVLVSSPRSKKQSSNGEQPTDFIWKPSTTFAAIFGSLKFDMSTQKKWSNLEET